MRDHLVAKDFRNPSEMALHADKLWDARRAQAVDSLLAAASKSPSRARGRERSNGSPVRWSQTPRPAGAGDCYFHKRNSVTLLISAVLHGVSRETPESTGGGVIKQSSCQQFSHLSPGYPLQPQLFGRHRCITLGFSTPFISCSHRSSFTDGWWSSYQSFRVLGLSRSILVTADSSSHFY